MPNGNVHRAVGAAAGAGSAYVVSSSQEPLCRLLEVIGGAIGGNFGARLPDLFDPATSPNHRSTGHAVVPAAAVLSWYAEQAPRWIQALRIKAEELAAKSEASENMLLALIYTALEWLARMAAGAVSGIAVGHASHLALDACTPRGLPVV
tara:strand:- start:187 stop:636 length:450 start_codon:yes stop_codon:yes gene_type:complete